MDLPFTHQKVEIMHTRLCGLARACMRGRRHGRKYRRQNRTHCCPEAKNFHGLSPVVAPIKLLRTAHAQTAVPPRRRIRRAPADLAAHWDKASREYEAGVYRELAEVRLSPRGMNMLELLGPYVTQAAAKTAGKPDRKGWVSCTLPLESGDFGIRELMRLGDDVAVLGPPALRARVAAAAQRIAKIHAPH
jgi:WYL domain